MMKRKLIVLLAVSIMTTGVLAGCGNREEADFDTPEIPTTEVAAKKPETTPIVKPEIKEPKKEESQNESKEVKKPEDKPDNSKNDNSKPDNSKPDNSKPDNGKPDNKKPADGTPAPKPDNKKPADSTPAPAPEPEQPAECPYTLYQLIDEGGTNVYYYYLVGDHSEQHAKVFRDCVDIIEQRMADAGYPNVSIVSSGDKPTPYYVNGVRVHRAIIYLGQENPDGTMTWNTDVL